MTPLEYILKNVPESSTVLDVGCGNKAYSKTFSKAVTVDAWEKVKPTVVVDLETHKLPFEKDSFEYVFMLDFIEHLGKDRGISLLDEAKQIAQKRVYLLTPLWWQTNEKHTNKPTCWAYGNPYNLHKSLWTVDDFVKTGWTEIGWERKGMRYFWGYWEKPCLQS